MTRTSNSLVGLRQVEDEIQHRQRIVVETDPTWDQTTEHDRFITMSIEAMRQIVSDLNTK